MRTQLVQGINCKTHLLCRWLLKAPKKEHLYEIPIGDSNLKPRTCYILTSNDIKMVDDSLTCIDPSSFAYSPTQSTPTK